MFVSVYTTNPPVLSPAAINAAGAGAHVALPDGMGGTAPLAVFLASGYEGIDVEASTSAGTCRLCAWFWENLPTTVNANGGQWVPSNSPPQGPIVGSVTFAPTAGQVDGTSSVMVPEGEYLRFAWVSGGWQSCT
jgi:hypothetical protein